MADEQRPTARRRFRATTGISRPSRGAGEESDTSGGTTGGSAGGTAGGTAAGAAGGTARIPAGTGIAAAPRPSGTADETGRVVSLSVMDRTVRPQLHTMLRDLYGVDRRGAIDTAAVAAAHGVSRRTVQRWLKEGFPRRRPHAAARRIQEAWQDSPAGRRRRISPQRRRLLLRGAHAVVFAAVTVSTPDPRNGRPRRFNIWLDGAEGRLLLDAVILGDVPAAEAFLAIAAKGFGGDVDLDVQEVVWEV